MTNSTTNSYAMKREILTFSNKISKTLAKPDKKFTADMTYGMLASKSCLLTDISDCLHEPAKKVNTVERLSRHLAKGIPEMAEHSYRSLIRKWVPTNTFTFEAMETGSAMFEKATFVMDRGYDDNKMFLKLDELHQDYVIRITSKRKLYYQNKCLKSTELRNRRKGKIKLPLLYHGKKHVAYLSHVKVQITASKKDVYLVLVYGITEHPMMLVTNKKIASKEDVINVANLYFSRWRIEEYFRSKKQLFQFENFRVRKLTAINALNFYITLSMAFLANISLKAESNDLKATIIQKANPIKQKVLFQYYRIAKGISAILSYAKEGIRRWFKTKRPAYYQLSFRFIS